MLNLDILCKKISAVSPLQVRVCPDIPSQQPVDICRHYTEKLTLAQGQAGHVITDEFLFCGKLIQKQTGAVLLIGPATDQPLSMDAKKRVSLQMGLRSRQAHLLEQELSDIPIIPLTQFLQQLSFLNYIINEEEHVQSSRVIPPKLPASAVASAGSASIHNTALFEAEMLSCIEHGKVDTLKALLEAASLNQYTTGIVSTEAMRAQKNIFVTSITLASRSAVKGGLDYDLSMHISDKYLQQIEGVDTFDGFMELLSQMLLDYATRTANLRLCEDASPLVRAVAQRISGQLYQKISVEQLAQDQNVSRSHLSHQFKKETGKTLTDYIAQQKIDEAIRLLQTTELSLAQIAYQLAFSSQSYFHATFKKITGINPGKYPRYFNLDPPSQQFSQK